MTSQPQETWAPEWTFGDRLRKVRRERGITQGQAADALGVKASQVASWETAGNNPRDIVATAKRCHLAWGVSVEWMLGLETQNTPRPDGPEGISVGRAWRDSNSQPSDPKVLPLRVVA